MIAPLILALALSDPLAGRATVIDGDTLEIRDQRIRLWGVDAPEGRQTCTRGGQSYRCGQEAANALDGWISGRTVRCEAVGRPDRYRRIVARCQVAGQDMGGWMVRQGWALDFPRYSRGTYAGDQASAQAGHRGVWAGEFQEPWEWRGR